MNTEAPRSRFGRTLIIAATAIGVTIGAAGLAGAAQAVLGSSEFSLNDVPLTDDSSLTTDNTITDDTTGGSTDDTATDNSTDDSTTDNSTDDSTDDSTDNSTDDSDDDDSTSSSNPDAPLPAPFSQTYNSTGGSITVTWTGTAFVLDSVSAADGYTAQIEDQRWDRIRVDFEGDNDSRIEVRISDDDNSVRVRID